jgi:hypothetical protein
VHNTIDSFKDNLGRPHLTRKFIPVMELLKLNDYAHSCTSAAIGSILAVKGHVDDVDATEFGLNDTLS